MSIVNTVIILSTLVILAMLIVVVVRIAKVFNRRRMQKAVQQLRCLRELDVDYIAGVGKVERGVDNAKL